MQCFSSGHTCCVTFSLTCYPYFRAYLCFTSTPQAHLPYFTSRSTNFTAVTYPPCFISRPTCRASLPGQPAMFSSRPTCRVSLPGASAMFHFQVHLPYFSSRFTYSVSFPGYLTSFATFQLTPAIRYFRTNLKCFTLRRIGIFSTSKLSSHASHPSPLSVLYKTLTCSVSQKLLILFLENFTPNYSRPLQHTYIIWIGSLATDASKRLLTPVL
jgi:hypothetical protein